MRQKEEGLRAFLPIDQESKDIEGLEGHQKAWGKTGISRRQGGKIGKAKKKKNSA